MKEIDILITTSGRPKYFDRLINSIQYTSRYEQIVKCQFHIVFNGVEPIKTHIGEISKNYVLEKKLSIDAVMQYITPQISCPLFMKLDEDAEIVSLNFLDALFEINKLIPEAVFSPFPVGLINNLGGPQALERRVVYSKWLDRYFTLRKVHHVGGFSRVMPSKYLKDINFGDGHNEDGTVSEYCRSKNIDMFYLENGLVVEHQESTLGQHVRYPEYFGERF